MLKERNAASLCGAVTVCMWVTSVSAQENPPTSTQLEEIVVSSTRIERDGYDAPTPTTVIGKDLLQTAAPATMIDALALMPAFRNVATTGTANQAVAGTGGQSFVNLRGLGATRSLVLLNGERLVPTTSNATVDVALLPSGLIDRVDVVTGGASAAWGSDAVAGVVNFVLDEHFEGFKGDVSGGVSSRGDNDSGKVSLTWGDAFMDDRLHVLLSGEYYDSDGVPSRSRPWSDGGALWNDTPNPAYLPGNGQPQFLRRENFYFGNVNFNGVILGGPLAGTEFLPNGQTSQYTFCSPNGAGGQYCNAPRDLPHFNYFTLMSTPQTRKNAFGRVSYELSPDLTVSLSAIHGESDTEVRTAFPVTNLTGPLTIARDNAYLPASLGQQMDTLGLTSFALGRAFRDFPEGSIRRENELDSFSASLKATVQDWKFDLWASQGVAHNRYKIVNNTILGRLRLASDAVVGPGGTIVCRSTLTNPTNGCQPLNPFGDGSSSRAAIDYITATSDADLRMEQFATGLTANGTPLDSWAGPISVALGAEYREQEAKQTVDAFSAARAFMLLNPQPLYGKLNVKEAFAETVVPLAHELPGAQTLDLNAAVRYTDYSTSGEVMTWKGGLTYSPVNDVTLRATRSRDIRAPNVLELFQSPTQGTMQVVDPRTGLPDTFQGLTGGNPNLKEESADTVALGIVYRPQWLEGFATSIDYYRIEIEDAISTLGAQDVVNRCFQGLTAYCGSVHRDGTGDITTVDLFYLNYQQLRTSGIDFEMSYSFPIGNGTLGLRALANYLDEYVIDDGVRELDVAGSIADGLPQWSWKLSALYDHGPWKVLLNANRIGGGTWNPRFTYDRSSVDGIWYLDATVETNLGFAGMEKGTVYVNVENLLDKEPPYGFGFQNGLYDRIGTTFKLGVRFEY